MQFKYNIGKSDVCYQCEASCIITKPNNIILNEFN